MARDIDRIWSRYHQAFSCIGILDKTRYHCQQAVHQQVRERRKDTSQITIRPNVIEKKNLSGKT